MALAELVGVKKHFHLIVMIGRKERTVRSFEFELNQILIQIQDLVLHIVTIVPHCWGNVKVKNKS